MELENLLFWRRNSGTAQYLFYVQYTNETEDAENQANAADAAT